MFLLFFFHVLSSIIMNRHYHSYVRARTLHFSNQQLLQIRFIITEFSLNNLILLFTNDWRKIGNKMPATVHRHKLPCKNVDSDDKASLYWGLRTAHGVQWQSPWSGVKPFHESWKYFSLLKMQMMHKSVCFCYLSKMLKYVQAARRPC